MIAKKSSDKKNNQLYSESNQKQNIFQKYSEKAIEILKSFFSDKNLDEKKQNNAKTTIILNKDFLNEANNNPYAKKLEKFSKEFKMEDVRTTTKIIKGNSKQEQDSGRLEIESSLESIKVGNKVVK